MKTFSRAWSFLLVFVTLALAACTPGGAVQQAVDKVDNLVKLYQSAQGSASNFQLCVDTAYGKITTSTQQANRYFDTDVAKVKAWRDVLAQRQAQLSAAQAAYKDAQGNPIPAEQLDLAALQEKGALPDNLSASLALVVNSVVEAPVAPVSEKIGLALIDTTNEAYNSIQACGVDWNAHVTAYNTERNQATTDIVTTAANYLHLRDLPRELPRYKGGHADQPIGNPLPQEAPTASDK